MLKQIRQTSPKILFSTSLINDNHLRTLSGLLQATLNKIIDQPINIYFPGIYTATYPDKVDKFVAVDGLLPFHQPNDQVIDNLRKAVDMVVDDTFNHKKFSDLDVLSEKITRTIFYKGMETEVAQFMLERSIQMLPDGYQFTYDKRLRYPA